MKESLPINFDVVDKKPFLEGSTWSTLDQKVICAVSVIRR